MAENPQQSEEWKEIEGWNGYFISNFGNVRRQSREFENKMIEIKGSTMNKGYRYVQEMKNGKHINHMIHRLVAKAFIQNPDDKPCVDHIDNNKLNNHYTNLRWCYHYENCKNQKPRTEGKKNGARYDEKKQRWIADIRINDKNKFLGYFNTYEQAREAREKGMNNQ